MLGLGCQSFPAIVADSDATDCTPSELGGWLAKGTKVSPTGTSSPTNVKEARRADNRADT